MPRSFCPQVLNQVQLVTVPPEIAASGIVFGKYADICLYIPRLALMCYADSEKICSVLFSVVVEEDCLEGDAHIQS